MNENLRPHELADQLRQREYEIVDGRVESARLGSVLKRMERITTYGKRYEENEHGYVSVDGLYRGFARDNESYLVAATVTFHDPVGNETELGSVRYIDKEREKATAIIQTREGEGMPLLPDHDAWDIVVGNITRAVDEAWLEQKRPRN